MAHRLTGSGLEVPAICPPAGALPQARTAPRGFTEAGIAKHHYLSVLEMVGRDAALLQVPEAHRQACLDLELEKLPLGPRYETEVAFTIDPLTGSARRLGVHLNRDYSQALPHEIPLTLDVVSTEEVSRAQGYVEVYDYKGPHAEFEPAKSNLQVSTGALAATSVYGLDDAQVGLIRLKDDGSPGWDRAHLDCLDLDLARVELRNLALRVAAAAAEIEAGKVPTVVTGPHCADCLSIAACPAQATLLMMMAMTPQSVGERLRAMVETDPPRAYAQLKIAQTMLELVEAAVKAYAKRVPIDLGGGKVYGGHETEYDVLDPEIVHRVVEQMHGTEIADLAAPATREASKASIARALKPLAQSIGNKLAPMERKVLQHVQAEGGLRSAPGLRVEVFRRGRGS